MAVVAGFLRVFSRRALLGIVAAALAAAVGAAPALANVALLRISADPFTNSTSQHATEVEADTYSFGSTIVAAVQQGRFLDGGASDAGFATSTDSGATWTSGSLPGTTTFVGGRFDRVSDPSVAFDARHNVWLIATLPLLAGNGAGVIVSRSTDGGHTWTGPVTVNADPGTDKDWIACDDTATSPFYGHCYAQWDNNAQGNLIQMSTSTDGGLTWGPARTTPSRQTGIGGQPVVQPNGTVVVPIDNANETSVAAFVSTDGGSTWSNLVTIATIREHTEAAGLRSGPLPSAEIDGAGRVFVAWSDCRFRRGCRENDIVFSTSTNGTTWSAVTRVPIDPRTSAVDHFLPGLGVDRTTAGGGARVGLSYYFYPNTRCSAATCQLDVGFISSANGGATWGAATQLAGPMSLGWLANTTQGRMVGDYQSTSFAGGTAHPGLVVASAPSGGVFAESLFTPASGLRAAAGAATGEVAPADLVPAGTSGVNRQDARTAH
jgi:hypothetical protein